VALFTIRGLKEITRAFDVLPDRLAKKVLRQAIRKALRPIFAEVVAKAPEGKTHLLKASVKIRAVPKRRRGVIALQVRIGTGDFKGATFYAAFVEYGTRRQKQQNYMKVAFLVKRDEATKIAVDQLVAGVERELRAGA
jgi:HK97 gp10 family phage protein